MSLRQAVVVGATPDGDAWVDDLLASLGDCPWPVEVHRTREWELATIAWAARRWDEYVFLPQSTVVLAARLFERAFTEHAEWSVSLASAQKRSFRMYLGKYRSAAVVELGVPTVPDKAAAIHQETAWCGDYATLEAGRQRLVSIGGPLDHTDRLEHRHGRLNMVVENEYLRRWKGTAHQDPDDSPSVQTAIQVLAGGGR